MRPNSQLRRPSSLDEDIVLVRLYMSIICGLFAVSGSTVIGGDIQTYGIPAP